MNILIPDSWLREYLKTDATPKQLKDNLSLCGPSIERINTVGKETVYDIEITSNRVDMASVYGIAREAAAILPRFGIKATLKSIPVGVGILPPSPHSGTQTGAKTAPLPLSIKDPHHLCHRILAIVIDNVTVKPAPDYMKDRIEKSGVRSLNNLIDITNYVMLELGHPCHVFDYDRIATGTLHLRNAKPGETLVTLDNKACTLTKDDVVIDDGTGRIIDLPGIMGTANSVVTDKTKRIVVFIESNDPVTIRRTSMRLGLRSYAATINEKGPDPELAKTALLRAADLYRELAGGTIAGPLIDVYPKPSKPKSISVTTDFINDRLGIPLKQAEIVNILRSLSFQVHGSLTVTPPSFRQSDITIPEDIVEEVARLYGYYKLPGRLMSGEIPVSDKPKDLPLEGKIKQSLKYWGYTEIYTYSFISAATIAKAGMRIEDHVKVANPLTEEIAYMRRSLIPSMLSAIEKNQHQRKALSLFELSHVYIPKNSDLPEEKGVLVLAKTSSYRELKGDAEQLLDEIGVTNWQIERCDAGQFHPNKSAQWKKNGRIFGLIGSIHPGALSQFGIKQEVYAAVFPIDELIQVSTLSKRYVPLSSYPATEEDLTLVVPEKTEIGRVLESIRTLDPLIQKAMMKDTYKQTVTVQITYHDPGKNLTSDDTQKVRGKILDILKKQCGIELKS